MRLSLPLLCYCDVFSCLVNYTLPECTVVNRVCTLQHIRFVDSECNIVGDGKPVGRVDCAVEQWDGSAVCVGMAESDTRTQTTESLRQHVQSWLLARRTVHCHWWTRWKGGLVAICAYIVLDTGIIWALVEQSLTSHQTHYRSYRGPVLWVKRRNQQCQSTEGREVLRTKHQPIRSTPLCWQ